MQEISYKEKIIRKNNNTKLVTHLEWYTRQSYSAYTHLLQELISSILTVAPLQYFSGCFPLAFLESYCPFLSLEVTSLCLDFTTWNLSVPSNKAASSTSTSFQSCWRYSNYFFFFFSSTSFFLCLGLCLSPCFLSHMLHTMNLCCLLQTN